jgi:hypothetical protein
MPTAALSAVAATATSTESHSADLISGSRVSSSKRRVSRAASS